MPTPYYATDLDIAALLDEIRARAVNYSTDYSMESHVADEGFLEHKVDAEGKYVFEIEFSHAGLERVLRSEPHSQVHLSQKTKRGELTRQILRAIDHNHIYAEQGAANCRAFEEAVRSEVDKATKKGLEMTVLIVKPTAHLFGRGYAGLDIYYFDTSVLMLVDDGETISLKPVWIDGLTIDEIAKHIQEVVIPAQLELHKRLQAIPA